MRILMLAHRIPYPPHTGDTVRAYHIARYLAQRHELTLACLVGDPSDWQGVEALRDQVGPLEFANRWKPWGTLKGLPGLAAGKAVTLSYFTSRRLRGRIANRRPRAFVEAHHSWEGSLARLEGLLHSAAMSRAAAGVGQG